MDLHIDAASIMQLHDCAFAAPGIAARGGTPPWEHIAANHHFNCLLWDEEDRARRTNVPDSSIAASKRLIDQYNQRRNDAAEAIDTAILDQLAGLATLQPGARQSSETAGAMIDRLSILALKVHHMRRQAARADAGAGHREACRARLERLVNQRTDLARCLDRLLAESAQGLAYFTAYRQFKMYNDPALNPWLNGQMTQGTTP